MAQRIDPTTSGQPAPPTGGEGLDDSERRLREDPELRRLLEDPELADYLRQKRAAAARIAGEATVQRARKG